MQSNTIVCRGKVQMTDLQARELELGKKGIAFQRVEFKKWTKIVLDAWDMVFVYKPDGSLFEQRTKAQDLEKSLKTSVEEVA